MVHIPPLAWAAAAAGTIRLISPTRRVRRGAAPAAAALAGASLLVGIAAVGEFRRHGTTADPMAADRASTLVTTGPYRFSRNPMYVALTGGVAAYAVWRGRAAGVVPVAGVIAALTRFQIAEEETVLRARFPAEFAALSRSTPRWLGPRSFRPA